MKDLDGVDDIALVTVSIPEIVLSDTLVFSSTTGDFQNSLEEKDLPGGNLLKFH